MSFFFSEVVSKSVIFLKRHFINVEESTHQMIKHRCLLPTSINLNSYAEADDQGK